MLTIDSVIVICSITDILNRIHTKILDNSTLNKKESDNLYIEIKNEYQKVLRITNHDEIEKTYIIFKQIYNILNNF
jgi:hypothetical protein